MAKQFEGLKNVGTSGFPTYWAVFTDAATGAWEDRERMVVDILCDMGGTPEIPVAELEKARAAYETPLAYLLAYSR